MRASLCVAVAAVAAMSAAAVAAAWPGPPPGPAPRVQGASGPPAAWLESQTRSLWLAFSSYCWRTTCADYLPPRSRTDLPRLRVSRGALVRIHFAFTPAQVQATTFAATTRTTVRLRAGRTTSWRPQRSGVVSFEVRAAAGSASYLVRLRVG